MTPTQIEKKYESLQRRYKKIEEDRIVFENTVKEFCHHPDKYKWFYEDEHDDGYGKWWTTRHCKCQVCNKRLY